MCGVTTGGAGCAAQNGTATSHRQGQPSPALPTSRGPKRLSLARAASEAPAPSWTGRGVHSGRGHSQTTITHGRSLTGPREPNPTHSSQRRLGTGRQPGSSSVPAAGGAWMPSCLAKVPDRLPPGVLCTADSSAVPHPITCPSPVPIKGGVPVSMITPFYLPLGAHRKPQ